MAKQSNQLAFEAGSTSIEGGYTGTARYLWLAKPQIDIFACTALEVVYKLVPMTLEIIQNWQRETSFYLGSVTRKKNRDFNFKNGGIRHD